MYSPRIKEDYVRQLYQLKQIEKIPMTKMVNEAIAQYLLTKQQQSRKENSDERRN
ncbi:MAG: hypothetical protein ACYCVH_11130 [Ignavibacteriaceae bacterium]